MFRTGSIFLILSFSILGNLLGKDTLMVGYNLEPPFVTLMNENQLFGPSVWLWENIAEENNIPFKYKQYSLQGLLEGLQNGQVDLALSPLTITSDRSQVINFTAPYYIAYSTILQLEVSTLQKTIEFIKSFFSINFIKALGALGLVILIFGIFIWLFERKKNIEEFDHSISGILDGFWWSAVTMTTVGYGDKSPKTLGGRIVSLIWMFTAIIIISGFTASIASSLTINNISSKNNQISHFKGSKLGTIGNSATSDWLKNNFFANKLEFSSLDEMVNALEKNKIDAIAYDRPILQTVVKNDSLRKYHLLPIKFNPQFYAFGMSKNLPDSTAEIINYSMLYNQEKIDWKILLSENGLE